MSLQEEIQHMMVKKNYPVGVVPSHVILEEKKKSMARRMLNKLLHKKD